MGRASGKRRSETAGQQSGGGQAGSTGSLCQNWKAGSSDGRRAGSNGQQAGRRQQQCRAGRLARAVGVACMASASMPARVVVCLSEN